jgi:hypothetical protein
MKTLDRRTLLRGAGGVAIALPFLDAMAPRRAVAATLPRRLFVMAGQNGTVPSSWFPSGTEKQFTLASSMAPLEPLKEHLIIPDGVTKMQRGTQDNTAHGRGMASALTGWSAKGGDGIADGASIDQVVAKQIGGETRIPSLMTGRVSNYHLFHDGPRQVHYPEPSVQKNFDRLFAGFTPPAAAGGAVADPGAAADLAKLRARKKSILDATMDQYRKVASQVGPGDRHRLEVHTEAIRKLELQIDAAAKGPVAATASCTKPAAPGQDTDYITNGQSNLELAALAFACDLTRVAGYQWISHGTVFNWLGITEKHHPLAHQTGNAGADAQLTKIVTWHAEQVAAFLTKLKSYGEGPGTVLDNTVFLWTWSVSVGSHRFDRGPFLLASGKFPLPGGGTLQTGRYLKYNGNPHTSLLQSVANLYGVAKMPVYPDWDKGYLPGLY